MHVKFHHTDGSETELDINGLPSDAREQVISDVSKVINGDPSSWGTYEIRFAYPTANDVLLISSAKVVKVEFTGA